MNLSPAAVEQAAKVLPRGPVEVLAPVADQPSLPARAMTTATAGRRHHRAPIRRGNIEQHWALDPTITFLNHGSYGAVPRAALRAQAEYRERVERNPVLFYKHDLEHLLDGVREKLGAFLNAPAGDLAPICNATWALCTILKATGLRPGDEVLITDHEYGSLTNELERVCAQTGARVVKAVIPFPLRSSQEVIDRYLSCVTARTRIAFISHITSASSMIFPVAPILRELASKGIDTVLDGAHSPGQIPVDIRALQPTYFVGSGHKWLNAPKGTGFMYVRPDRQRALRPLALSSRANKVRPERALFLRDFDYQGTDDYTAVLTLPHSIEATGSMLQGGWPALMRHNHELVLAARDVLCDALGCEPHCPDSMVGSMSTLRLPEPPDHLRDRPTAYDDALQDALFERHRIVVPIWRLPGTDERVVRISAQVYNTIEQYELLARALRTEIAREHA